MGYSFAFMIQKGGVGKTSVCGNSAFTLNLLPSEDKEERKKPVILIDSDPQGSLTSWLLPVPTRKIELTDFLEEKPPLDGIEFESLFVEGSKHEERIGIDILPTFGIKNRLRRYAETRLESEPFAFRNLLTQLKEKYQYILIDTSPATSRLERSILLGVNEVITPLTPDYFSVDGIQIFREFLASVKENWMISPSHKGIVINNMNNSYIAHKGYQDQIKKLSDFFIITIPQDRQIANSQITHESVIEATKLKSTSSSGFIDLAIKMKEWANVK